MGRRADEQLRTLLAREAARIIREQGVRDYGLAKRKARERLGLAMTVALPKNTEIEAQLSQDQRLFGASGHRRRLTELRESAVRAMQLLEPFRPRLVGPVLSGTATEHQPVQLHVFADAPEAVALSLMDRGVTYRSMERRLRARTGEGLTAFPAFTFGRGDVEVEVTVFPERGLRQAPLSPVDGRQMRRADVHEVRALIDAEADPEALPIGD